MGGLHEGHLSLVRMARERADCVVASIFVNRLQFAPTEDFEQYPRVFADDCRLLAQQDTTVVFAPAENTLYPIRQEFMVEPGPVANTLEGQFRPGFFRGVATVVLSFSILCNRRSQCSAKKTTSSCITRELVNQFNYPVEIVAGETVRAADNLALSFRTRYLTGETRAEATRLYQVLAQVKHQIEYGSTCFHDLEQTSANSRQHGWKTDYVAVRQAHTLAPAGREDKDIGC